VEQYQQTLAAALVISGIGVHTGKLSVIRLVPAGVDHGIIFTHQKFPNDFIKIGSVVPENAMHATVLKCGTWSLSTVEHLMAALYMLGVDNVLIEVDGFEIPILDGSALPFVQSIQEVGLKVQESKKRYLVPSKELNFADDQGRSMKIVPCKSSEQRMDSFGISIEYEFVQSSPYFGATRFKDNVSQSLFFEKVSPARTFGFLEQLPYLRKHGLAQGTNLGNTVVMSADGVINEMRFPDECVRHKVLDLIGDLALLGHFLKANICAKGTGHSFNRLVIQDYIEKPENWNLV